MFENLVYVYLSGYHKTLPKAEVKAIAEAEGVEAKPVLELDQLLVLYSSRELMDLLKLRSAYSRRIGWVLWIGRSENIREGVARASETLHQHGIESVKMEYRNLRGQSKGQEYEAVLRAFSESGLRLSRGNARVVDVISSQEVTVIGLRVHEIRMREFLERWSNRRPVYLPGALNPDISRIFVNLSRASVRRGTLYYDPFCGVGSFLLEACSMGLRYVGSDIDQKHVLGAAKNLASYGCEPEVFLADACRMPVHDVGAIGTDMPYGRQTKPSGGGIVELIKCFLESAESSLRRKSYLVFAQAAELEDEVYRVLSRLSFELVEVHRNWVHGSLTRNIYVLRRE